ncbi:hypothetical protein BCR35DRAFT_286283 [Leucosporidium creatinivorum]|uniref:Allergen n=1 Tax=Leucosporidium creatinivorum TaxID=106004 RepID=A0A1Y2G4L5_9BASI|nr:hypothetical protein BCR35DRAFT_286283 [Leucosporidium creatinivorum]
MQAIKKVFNHDDSNTSPSGHFKTDNEDYDSSKSAQHPTNTPNHAAPSAPAKVAEKAAGIDPSHAAGALSDSQAKSGNNRETGTHVVGSQDTSTHQNPASSSSNGLDNDRGITGTKDTRNDSLADRDNALGGASRNTGAESTSHGGLAGRAEQAVEQHATPPQHSHQQPKEFTHLDQQHARDATHDHKHLAPVTHEKHHHHETEEVTRQREVDRHIHHVQHHVQPVHDTQHADKVHHEQIHPMSHVEEKHVNTAEDKAALAGLNKHHDSLDHAAKDRVVVDKGEIVNENQTHHVHHVVQPVIERDTHEHHTIHTTIPTSHVVHESPIVHASVEHEPMHLKDFVKGGGDLKSKLTHDSAGILSEGDCARKVDGPAEGLLEKLHLKSDNHTNAETGAAGEQGISSTGGQGLSSTASKGLSSHQNEGLATGNHASPSGHTGSHVQADGRHF